MNFEISEDVLNQLHSAYYFQSKREGLFCYQHQRDLRRKKNSYKESNSFERDEEIKEYKSKR